MSHIVKAYDYRGDLRITSFVSDLCTAEALAWSYGRIGCIKVVTLDGRTFSID